MVCLRRLTIAAVLSLPVADTAAATTTTTTTTTTTGISELADRLFNGQGSAFEFVLTTRHGNWSRWNPPVNDSYTVQNANGKIRVEGTTLNALARGLRHYANQVLQVDEFWFVDTYKKIPQDLPVPEQPLSGASVVPWRYNLNTVTFSYNFAWYQWEDWEKLLDWAALRGVNLQLAWVGYEKIFLDSFRELGLSNEDILPFFSGPAFQAWNRFGNIQRSWGGKGDVPLSFIEQQFDLQKKIVARMVELGITPVLPAFPGFVPDSIKNVRPNANLTVSPNWFAPAPDRYTRDLFLDPLDDTYAELQKLFVSKQIEAFGNVTNIYTLDQFNELSPMSGESAYLSGISRNTYAGLTAANPAAVWLLQGWLFYSSRSFWTQPRIDAYLGGVEDDQGMLVLDLYSEVNPQWQRTNSYSGKPWIWCQLHDFGGNMALEGRVQTLTSAPIDALAQSESLAGFGLTPEAYEGNEIVYDILLDQAWSPTPLDTQTYFESWVTKRYAGVSSIPSELYQAWEILRTHVYSNTRADIPQVAVATYQLRPALSGIVNRTGHFPHPTAVHYDPVILQTAWELLLEAVTRQGSLWLVPAFQLDFIDVTRQMLSNQFDFLYVDLVKAYECSTSVGSKRRHSNASECDLEAAGCKLLSLLSTLDDTLLSSRHFTLRSWVDAARSWGRDTGNQNLFAFNARSQVTVWQVNATNLNDYAAKAWGGLVGSYYKGRWSIFVDALVAASKSRPLDQDALTRKLQDFEADWQAGGDDDAGEGARPQDLRGVLLGLQGWPELVDRFLKVQ
ncbi:Alpha-N-acetylglucosaminidase [Metarhizium album ARSEF 1941]|uniref:Alpha-N-acetylglucosaminidase n=1 Tax=Metarhizium album (strain ARSEF 1941) TaxID=1081103 RepID=A0A0B2WT24_METAS|nr:Alpha-N-acetylglucosaminidase [Metarhizium album ARSEF 1941]KHN96120.1 Alpha-N-acetylglucosaminidase [Metarhizium album ARSEF 1941]